MTIKPPLPTKAPGNARLLRRAVADAERELWHHLRAGRFDGLEFRRQHPNPPYIADSACAERKRVIEIDGSRHDESIDDARRTPYLQSQGRKLLRFWSNDALNQTQAVLQAIWDATRPRTLTPIPLPMGEGLKNESQHDDP